jgi:G2/mitotic-specific cyclin 2
MVDYLARPVTHEAFFKKYASKKFLKGQAIFSRSNPFSILTEPNIASILTRSWAKKHAEELGIDVTIPLEDAPRQ